SAHEKVLAASDRDGFEFNPGRDQVGTSDVRNGNMSAEIETEPGEQNEMDIEPVRDQFYKEVNFNDAMELRITKKLNLRPAPVPSTGGAAAPPAASTDQLWAALECAELDQSRARRGRIVAFARSEPAYASFGVLRTKVLKSLRLNNWTTVAIT